MNILCNLSIRRTLLLLFLVIIAPFLAITIYSTYQIRSEAIENARQRTIQLVGTIVDEQHDQVVSTSQLLSTLARMPEFQQGNVKKCTDILLDLSKQNSMYANLLLVDKLGNVIASARSFKVSNVGHRKYFQDVLKTKEFSAGEYVVGNITKKPVLHYSYPIMDRKNALKGVLVAAFDLDHYEKLFNNALLPQGSNLAITDHKGIRLFRYPVVKKTIGHNDLPEMMNFMSGTDEKGTFFNVGVDGVKRLYAYSRIHLREQDPPYLFIRAGIPEELALEGANELMKRNLFIIGLTVLASIYFAWHLGNIMFVRRLERLNAFAGRVQKGEIGVRTSVPHTQDELGMLANAFDDMATAIEKRDREKEQAHRRLNKIIEFLPDATFVIDSNRKVIAWNRAIEQMTGVSKGDMIGKGNYEYALPFYGERRPVIIDLAFSPDEMFEIENYDTVYRSADTLYGEAYVPKTYGGKGAYLYLTASRLCDSSGNIIGAIESIRDITDRKKAEESLKKSERVLSDIVEFLPDATFVIDLEGKVIAWNRAIEEMSGVSKKDIIGQGNYAYSIPFYGERRQQLIDLIDMSDKDLETKYKYVRRKGNTLYAEAFTPSLYGGKGAHVWATGATLFDDRGNRFGAIESIRDITGFKRTEEALRESEALYRILFEGINDAVFVHDLDEEGLPGRFLQVNDVACRRLGYTKEELLSLTPQDITMPEEYERIADKRMIFGSKGEMLAETIHVTKDGQKIFVESNIRQFQYLGRKNALSISRDITERRRIEDEKRSLEELLQRAEKMESLGLLAGGVAHDLNNVLGIVVGYAEILIDETDKSNPMRDDLKKILEGGNRSAAIVQDLLTLARRGVQARNAVNLNVTITDCQKTPDFEKVFSYNPQVKLQTDLEAGLLNIIGSPVHLAKTIINLASNAVEAMPNGGVLKITTANQYLDMPIHGYDNIREGDYVVLSVSDTGEGIPERDIKRIFEPFYTKKIMGRSGTGLGLAVVWGTIKDHNGYINVDSAEGIGTTFTLYFPVTREEIDSEQISVSMSEYMGRGETILVVDDIKRQRELASRMLTKLNYKVGTVASGEEAIEYLKTNKADLIVLDMIMDPGIDGLETYEKIRELNPAQKAVIVSGFSESERVKEAQRIGAGAYVPKPYVLERLGMAVWKELNRTWAAADSPLF